MDYAENSRLIANLIRVGTVFAVDHSKRRCRFKSGKLETQWVKWITLRAGTTGTWNPPTVGEQGILFSPSGCTENGIVLVGIESDANPSPSTDPNKDHTRYPDGAVIEYDHAAGALKATGIKTALVQASEHFTVDCPESTFTGNVRIKGECVIEDLLTWLNGVSGSGGNSGNGNVITGDFTHSGGDMTSNGVVVHLHVHGLVMPGGGDSGGPH